jgi:hypothetical protein
MLIQDVDLTKQLQFLAKKRQAKKTLAWSYQQKYSDLKNFQKNSENF